MLSRVADNLYWMSRHLERAEHAASLIDEHLNLMLDSFSIPVDQRWTRVAASLGVAMPDGPVEASARPDLWRKPVLNRELYRLGPRERKAGS